MSFIAKYEGPMCPAECGNRIHAGDSVTYNEDDELVHAVCAPRPTAFEIGAHETVCGTHWIVNPCPYCDE